MAPALPPQTSGSPANVYPSVRSENDQGPGPPFAYQAVYPAVRMDNDLAAMQIMTTTVPGLPKLEAALPTTTALQRGQSPARNRRCQGPPSAQPCSRSLARRKVGVGKER
jgi:hypothetical protein